MVNSISAQVALLAFGVAIIAGLRAANSPTTILTRALLCMLLALVATQVFGALIQMVVRDHLLRRKIAIDETHVSSAIDGPNGAPAGDSEAAGTPEQ